MINKETQAIQQKVCVCVCVVEFQLNKAMDCEREPVQGTLIADETPETPRWEITKIRDKLW